MSQPSAAADAVDLDDLIDRSPWTGAQKTQLGLLFFAILLDGFDNLALALAIPSLATAWGVTRGDFGLTLALGLAGLTVGAVTAGPLGDRLGRKVGLLLCMALFGVFTVAIVFATGLTELAIFRFIAGLGLGGAVPNAAAMISEFTPARRQSAAVTMIAVAVPAGGMIGGLVGGHLLPAFGWQGLFLIAGLAPLILIPVLWLATPESPQQLVAQGRIEQAHKALRQLGLRVADGARLSIRVDETAPRASVSSLLSPALRRTTLCIWATFFCSLTVGYLFNNWIPSILAAIGMSPLHTSQGLLALNGGNLLASLIAAVLITRYGSKIMIAAGVAAVLSCAALAVLLPALVGQPLPILGMIFVMGAFAAMVSTPIFAVAAYAYPQSIRTTGIGFAVAMGRGGAILSAFLGGMTVNSADKAQLYFGMGAVLLCGSVIALSVLKRHIPPGRELQPSGAH